MIWSGKFFQYPIGKESLLNFGKMIVKRTDRLKRRRLSAKPSEENKLI